MLLKSGVAVSLVVAALAFAAGASRNIATAQTPPAQLPAQAATASQRTGDVIVRFRPSTSLSALGDALGSARTTVRASTAGSGLVLVSPGAGETVDGAIARLEADPNVEFAEPNTTIHLSTTTPNDPYYAGYQLKVNGVNGTTGNLQWIGMPTAWDTTTGSTSVTVAVLDTGVDSTHPDLAGRVVAGYDFINNDADPSDDHWHGTFVAGIIAANGNNATGIAGICWTCKIMPVKVLDSSGSGSMFQLEQGIDWAVAHGAKVINMSLGGATSDSSLQTSIDNAWNAGVVLVAAAGNDNSSVSYPAAANHVVAVGALDTDGVTKASFSNFGPQIWVSAPGVSVTSLACSTCTALSAAIRTQGYMGGSGTSFSSPEVAGVAALMVAAGTTSNATIVSTLKSTATDVGAAGFDNNTGWGRVNAALAVAGSGDTTAPTLNITAPGSGATVSGTVNITATASDGGSGMQKVQFWMDGTYLGYDTTAPFAKSWSSVGENGRHTITARAWDWANNVKTVSIDISVLNADNTAPTLSITSPADGATVAGTVSIAANATDAGGMQKVQFWVDGTYLGYDTSAPYTKAWNSAGKNGRHTITARAWDWANHATTVTADITVMNPDSTPPSVSITAPGNGSTVSGTVSIAANATDAGGMQKVQFWVDGTYLGYDLDAPYTKNWDSTSVADGAHTIKARAVDWLGNTTTVNVSITVGN